MNELPAALRSALAGQLEGVSRKDLATRAARTSEAYRAGRGSAGVIQGEADALAYALARLPATYAACAAVFAEAARIAPGFSPRGLLDAGSGPGGTSWAAIGVWPALDAVTWVDASPTFLDLGRRLAAQGPPALRDAQVLMGDLVSGRDLPLTDLVVASYALAEIPLSAQDVVVAALWRACSGVLALVEPGTPAGFQRILAARKALIGAGAELLAPCPHAQSCPIKSPDWCHFSVRLPRSRDHRLAKGAEVPFEDERFAYLIAARPGTASVARRSRVLAPPRADKSGISFKLCGPDGLEDRRVARRDKVAYAAARRIGWGEVME